MRSGRTGLRIEIRQERAPNAYIVWGAATGDLAQWVVAE